VSDEGRAQQDHPYLPHYGWPPDPGAEDRFGLTPERQAENAQHAADRQAVEGGRTLRLVLAAPVVVWSFAGIPALALFALALFFGVIGGADVDSSDMDPALVGFFVLLVLVEVASIWEATMLIRERLSVSHWGAVLVLSAVVAVAVTAALVVSAPETREWLLVLVVVWYCVAIAAWQWRRSLRLASAVARLENYSP
jgi:hypothetical protein